MSLPGVSREGGDTLYRDNTGRIFLYSLLTTCKLGCLSVARLNPQHAEKRKY